MFTLRYIIVYGWQSIRLEGSNRPNINKRRGQAFPKRSDKKKKRELICIGASKDMSEHVRVVKVINSISKGNRCWKCLVSPIVHGFIHHECGS